MMLRNLAAKAVEAIQRRVRLYRSDSQQFREDATLVFFIIAVSVALTYVHNR